MNKPTLLSFIQVGELCIPIQNIAYIDLEGTEAYICFRQSTSNRGGVSVSGAGVNQLRGWLDGGTIAVRIKNE